MELSYLVFFDDAWWIRGDIVENEKEDVRFEIISVYLHGRTSKVVGARTQDEQLLDAQTRACIIQEHLTIDFFVLQTHQLRHSLQPPTIPTLQRSAITAHLPPYFTLSILSSLTCEIR